MIPSGWYIGLIIIVIAVGILFLLVRWHARNFAYRCPECGQEFEISTFTDFISPHGGGKKYLRCPRCQKRSWANEMEKISQVKV
jgi:DNA-directed RNA polymerase subunit RPC12/RpoP